MSRHAHSVDLNDPPKFPYRVLLPGLAWPIPCASRVTWRTRVMRVALFASVRQAYVQRHPRCRVEAWRQSLMPDCRLPAPLRRPSELAGAFPPAEAR
jgi:hypothetical protein